MPEKIPSVYPAILLAAGQSTRFGSLKLLHALSNGQLIGVQSALNLQRVFARVLAVVHPQQPRLHQLYADLGLEVVINTQAQQGMGSSLATGVQACAASQGWVIALADMPFIQSSTLYQVGYALSQGATLVAPYFQGKRGHPVGFSASFGLALQQLAHDQGAATILQQHQHDLQPLATTDSGILMDIDTLEDLHGNCA